MSFVFIYILTAPVIYDNNLFNGTFLSITQVHHPSAGSYVMCVLRKVLCTSGSYILPVLTAPTCLFIHVPHWPWKFNSPMTYSWHNHKGGKGAVITPVRTFGSWSSLSHCGTWMCNDAATGDDSFRNYVTVINLSLNWSHSSYIGRILRFQIEVEDC